MQLRLSGLFLAAILPAACGSNDDGTSTGEIGGGGSTNVTAVGGSSSGGATGNSTVQANATGGRFGASSAVGGSSAGAGGATVVPGVISCLVVQGTANSMCIDAPGTTADCNDAGGTLVNRCPEAALLVCDAADFGETGSIYIYDQMLVDSLKVVNPESPCSALTGG